MVLESLVVGFGTYGTEGYELEGSSGRAMHSIPGLLLSRRRFLRTAVLTAGLVAIPSLAACGGDDDGDDEAGEVTDDSGDDSSEDDALTEAMEQAEEETDVELDALDDDGDDDRSFPDDFPDDIPLPDDSEIVSDMSYSRDDEREIYIGFVSHQERMEMIETYSSALDAAYEIDDEYINEELETAQWDFHGGDWEWARIQISDPHADEEAEFQVLVILRNYQP